MIQHLKYTLIICLLGCFSCAKPIAQFMTSSTEDKAPAEVTFTNESVNAETYEWDFGDGDFSSEESPKHLYQSSGN